MKTIQFDFENRPGLSRIYVVPVLSFLRIRKDYHNKTSVLEVKERGNIIDVPVYTKSFRFNENQTTEEAGETYNITITGCIPKLCLVNEEVISILERGEWLVLHQDNNGTIHLSGTITEPLSFKSNKTSGATSEELNGNSFQFHGTTAQASLIISMQMITEL